MAIYVAVRFRVRPESTEKCRQAIGALVEYVRQNKTGTQMYVSFCKRRKRPQVSCISSFFKTKRRASVTRIRWPSGDLQMCRILRLYRRWSSRSIRWWPRLAPPAFRLSLSVGEAWLWMIH